MDRNYRILTVGMCLLITIHAQGQYESSSYTATGSAGLSTTYLHDYRALGINPANIGTGEAYHIAFGFLEGGFSIHSQALSRTHLSQLLISNDSVAIPANLRSELGASFVNKGFSADLNFMVGGVALQAFQRVAFALKVDVVSSIRTRFNAFSSNYFYKGFHYDAYFDQLAMDNGGDTLGISSQPKGLYELAEGSYLRSSFTIPITVGSGFRVRSTEHYTIHAGVGAKYVLGIGLLDFEAVDGTIEGRGSYNETLPLGIELVKGSLSTSNGWAPAGQGLGFDAGINYRYKEVLNVGASVTDIGRMEWSRNTFEIRNVVIDTTGYAGAATVNMVDLYEQVQSDEAVIDKSAESFTVPMPTKIRMGAKWAPVGFLNVGMDVIIPVNNAPGNYESPYVGAGANVKVFNVLHFSAGFNYTSDYGFSFPVGIIFNSSGPKNYEAGLASRDFQSIFSEKNPNISYNMGFLRFKF